MKSIKRCAVSDAPFRLVLVEAFARLAAEQTCADHLAQQRVRTVFRIAELLVEHLHDGEVHVVADEVG